MQNYKTASEYVEMRLGDIFHEVAEKVADGEFELEHPLPIFLAWMHMTNEWKRYIDEQERRENEVE